MVTTVMPSYRDATKGACSLCFLLHLLIIFPFVGVIRDWAVLCVGLNLLPLVCCYCFPAEEREEARRNVAAMRRIQSMYMPEPKGDALVDEKQKVEKELVVS